MIFEIEIAGLAAPSSDRTAGNPWGKWPNGGGAACPLAGLAAAAGVGPAGPF